MMPSSSALGPSWWGRAWGWAALASLGVHAVLLAAIGAGTPAATPEIPLDPSGRAGFPSEPTALVDLAALDDAALAVAATAGEPAVMAPPAEDDRHAVPADEARRVPSAPDAPRAGPRDSRATPASDTGDGAGRRPADVAWRRDSSTLHERLTDGAERYQPAHTRTTRSASASSSPETVRRQPVVGAGDSPRTTRARAPAASASPARAAVEETVPAGASSAPAPEVGALAASEPEAPSPPLVPRVLGPLASPAEGPLDAERGATAFDVAPGDVVRDDRSLRAASSELHPSITDLTLAASPGDDARGRGPSKLPGAVARPSPGGAPAAVGLGGPREATGGAATTGERIYARYELDIRARVNGVLGRVWPRRLALQLEQGETMVSFVVLPDGRLAGPVRVTKSAGFEEFDRAAVEAIRLVTPFPPIPRKAGADRASPLPISLRVTFSNPVIR